MSPEAIRALAGIAISPDTMLGLQMFVGLAAKWTQRINLVSRATEAQIWQRHIADSVQLWPLIPDSARSFADLGSGGGFPGLALAVLARQARPGCRHVLIESDQRKATFLREAAREIGVPVSVLNDRIEAVPGLGADVVTARALAPLAPLLALLRPHLGPGGAAVLPKGAGYLAEVDQARTDWQFDLELFPSQTDPDARILRLTRIGRNGEGAN